MIFEDDKSLLINQIKKQKLQKACAKNNLEM